MLEMSFVMIIGLPFDLKISFFMLLEIRQVRVTLVVASELGLREGGIGLSRRMRSLLPTWGELCTTVWMGGLGCYAGRGCTRDLWAGLAPTLIFSS